MTITPGVNSTIVNTKTFLPLPKFDIDFELKAKVYNQEGDLKYEYNPLRNLRLATGELTEMRTNKLNFSLNSPIDITVQPSYDGTVNLILNDDRNPPRLINTRFTPVEDKRYKIIDRNGNNDTNIYDIDNVDQTTRLFKTTENIPYVDFQGLYEGGQLMCGNYVFYFKYSDADGNESDIITESGIVSCYIGKLNDPFSTRGGLADELTNKIIKINLLNLDTSYDYVNIYYTRSTADASETEVTEAYRITTRKIISGSNLPITITGLEDVQRISVDELNIQYNIVNKVKTQAQIQNMLFFGNVDKPTIPYKELEDLSLRVYPTVSNNTNIGYLDQNYNKVELDDAIRKAEYYDANNVYSYTGFWNKEMYRIGIVYIQKDDSLSPVFNIRGKNGIGSFTRLGTFANDIKSIYTDSPLYTADGKRSYIDYDEDGFIPQSQFELENSKGVVRLLYDEAMLNKNDKVGTYPLAIDFNISTEVLTEMKKYAKGFFFVRQKRIPTILAQGISIGVDNVSYLPAIYANVYDANNTKKEAYITESFMDKGNQLVNDFTARLLKGETNVGVGGLLCPEALLRSEYYNEVFNGALFNVSRAPFSPNTNSFTQSAENNRHFYISGYTNNGASEYLYNDIKLSLIEDGTPLRSSGTKTFSSRAGIPEEAWRTSSFGGEDRNRYASNLVRGMYTGYVGMEGFSDNTAIVDIHIPGYSLANMRDYFLLRASSFDSFYAMSNRYDLSLAEQATSPYKNIKIQADNYKFSEYRGDCFINNCTTRIMRNFVDPTTPITDVIIDPLSWKGNYTGYTANGQLNTEDIAKINRSDVNAVRIGHWATFKLCSNINLAYRVIDESNTSEKELLKRARSFYPYAAMSVRSESKMPESTVVNVGYNSTTSDKQYILLPDVPYIKNIFDNRIMFSDIHINDAFRNGYRVFQGLAYKDVTRQYGAIVKMFDWRNNLLIVFENGVGIMQINERALSASGGDIFIKGAGVLSDNLTILSADYGSSWKDSIIQTTRYIYGVDATAKKIWRTDGQSFELLSDFKVQKFLNDNITLGETEKYPLVALRNVKTHFNASKSDLMFTFYDVTRENEEIEWNICYNEVLDKWVTQYTWVPISSDSINNVYFSFDKNSAKKMALIGYTLDSSESSEGITLTDVNIKQLSNHVVGTIKVKDYYSKYVQVFTLEDDSLDNEYFTIVGNQLQWKGIPGPYPKFAYNLKIRVGLKLQAGDTNEIQWFYDFVSAKVMRSTLSSPDKILYDEEFSTYFWKHGQAGIFDISTPIEPTKWYDKQEAFEFEFVVSDGPAFHKIYDNLYIISNNAEPESFEFEVVGDAYDIDRATELSTGEVGDPLADKWTDVQPKLIKTHQLGKDLKIVGRLRGNMHYLEDSWNVVIKPHVFDKDGKIIETRIRDKYCKIRVRYSGKKLALITALQTLYTISYA